MSRIADTVKRSKFLRNNIARYVSQHCDTGEYHFLERFNYIGNYGIHWTHPQSSFIIRVTDDYQQCVKGNQLKDGNTCWCYFPKKILTILNNDFNEKDVFDIENELRNWKLMQTIPKKFFKWSVTLARCYSIHPSASLEQKCFGAKSFISAFYTDDSFENLIFKREYSAAAGELLKNLGFVFGSKFDQITDMNKFKGRNNIPDCYIADAIRSIEFQKEIVLLAKQLLKPKIYDLFLAGCHDYLNGIRMEKVLFQKNIQSNNIIGEQEGRTSRNGSIGLKWAIPAMMTDENTAVHSNFQNPVVDIVTLITILENDLFGYFRDKSFEFKPISFLQPGKSAESELKAAKIMANRSNEAKKVFEYIWENVPAEKSKHYEFLARLIGGFTDFYFVSRLRHTNVRYGWIPQLD